MNFPVFSQLARKLGFRDEFARDCLLLRRVVQIVGWPKEGAAPPWVPAACLASLVSR